MARMVFVALLVMVAVSMCMADLPKPKPKKDCCGKNEIWKKCGNPCREPKCDGRKKGVICPTVCVPRCECIKGTVRNKKGECVEPCDC